jgi:hypothetical protein
MNIKAYRIILCHCQLQQLYKAIIYDDINREALFFAPVKGIIFALFLNTWSWKYAPRY